MAGAALTYLAVAWGFGAHGTILRAWGTPMATDVAFALGATALLGRAVPDPLRAFVLALAVADDIASVVVLAFVSPGAVHPWPLLAAAALVSATAIARRHLPAAAFVVATAGCWVLLAHGGGSSRRSPAR
jgi:Na+:H+ antiporter, NhaA family